MILLLSCPTSVLFWVDITEPLSLEITAKFTIDVCKGRKRPKHDFERGSIAAVSAMMAMAHPCFRNDTCVSTHSPQVLVPVEAPYGSCACTLGRKKFLEVQGHMLRDEKQSQFGLVASQGN